MKKEHPLTKSTESKRIVFNASEEFRRALHELSGALELPKVGTLRLGVAMLAQIARELNKGRKLVFKNPDGTEREILIPQLSLGEDDKNEVENAALPTHSTRKRRAAPVHHV